MVTAVDFYSERHSEIYRAMLSLQLKGSPIDTVTLPQQLQGKLDGVGGVPYIVGLYEDTPMSANVKYYCQIVKEKAAGRRLVTLARTMATGAVNGEDLHQVLAEARSELTEIATGFDGFNGVSPKDILTFDDRFDRYTAYTKEIGSARFKTGFSPIDQAIRGVAPGELMIIIAYSGTFKTAFLQNLLLNGVERSGRYHMLFSLEMASEQVFAREMQIQSGVSGWDVEKHFSGKSVNERVKEGLGRKGGHGLLVCDKPRLTLEKIGRYIDIASQKYGRLGAVGVDYLGLIHADGKSVYEKTAFVSIEAKNLAKELNVPVIMLCQINRAAAIGGEIETHSAKGGGDVEAAADFMLGFQLEGEGKSNLTCKILKNRNGPAGLKLLVDIDRNALQFKDMRVYTEEPTKKSKSLPF